MSIENLTIKEVRELAALFSGQSTPKSTIWEVGKNYIIRTVTMINVGKLEEVTDKELKLSSAAWIADTGRFADAIKTGELNEVEPFPDEAIIGRGAIIDAAIWGHALPREQK